MTRKITTRVAPALILLSLLATDVAQAFCFLKDHDRRANRNYGRMPAIGFNPSTWGYPYSPVQPGWYGNQALLPQQLPYDTRRDDVRSGLQH